MLSIRRTLRDLSIIALLVPLAPAGANIPTRTSRADAPVMARVDRLGRIHVGDSIEGFPRICAERRRLEARGIKIRRAFYYLRAGLPPRCMNLQCGPFARQILARGGVLVGGAASDYAQEFGLADEGGNPALLVVTDLKGTVQALYRDARPADLAEVLRGLDD